MPRRLLFERTTWLAALIFVIATSLVFRRLSRAHENHAPLPSKGVTVAGETVYLADSEGGVLIFSPSNAVSPRHWLRFK